MRTPSDHAFSREWIRITFAATIVFVGLGVVSPAGNLEASARLSKERFDPFSAHQTVRRKSSRSGATWTALEGIFSCSTKKKAVELAELMVQLYPGARCPQKRHAPSGCNLAKPGLRGL